MKVIEVCYKPIGFVSVDASDEEVKRCWDKGLISQIKILPEYAEGLRGLDGFSHIIVVFHLHKVDEKHRRTLKVKPRGWLRFGIPLQDIPEVGVFATESPHRPNPIGISIVELLHVNKTSLTVRGLDAYNGTPILDIKPYTPSRVVEIKSLPKWYLNLKRKAKKATRQGSR